MDQLIIDDTNIRDVYSSFFNEKDDNDITQTETNNNYDVCFNCKCDVIIDIHNQGIRVCNSCGLILDNIYDNNLDWAGDDGSNKNITTFNVLLPQSSMSTSIAGWKSRVKTLHSWSLMPYKERSLYEVFKIIDSVCSKSGILKCIADDAKIKYKILSECKHALGKNIGKNIITRGNNRSGLIAACLDNSCKKKGISKPQKELASVFNIKEKDLTKGRKTYKKMMRLQKQNIDTQNSPSNFINRYCSQLKLSPETTNKAISIVNNLEKLNIATEHTPQSIAIGCILLLQNNGKLTNIIKTNYSNKFGLSCVTLSKVYNKLKKYLKIITDNNITDEVVNKINSTKNIIPKDVLNRMSNYDITPIKQVI